MAVKTSQIEVFGEELIKDVNKIVIDNIHEYGVFSDSFNVQLFKNGKLRKELNKDDKVTQVVIDGTSKIKSVVVAGNFIEIYLSKPKDMVIYNDPVRVGEKIIETR